MYVCDGLVAIKNGEGMLLGFIHQVHATEEEEGGNCSTYRATAKFSRNKLFYFSIFWQKILGLIIVFKRGSLEAR